MNLKVEENKDIKEGEILFIPPRRPRETDIELVKRCLVVRNVKLPEKENE